MDTYQKYVSSDKRMAQRKISARIQEFLAQHKDSPCSDFLNRAYAEDSLLISANELPTFLPVAARAIKLLNQDNKVVLAPSTSQLANDNLGSVDPTTQQIIISIEQTPFDFSATMAQMMNHEARTAIDTAIPETVEQPSTPSQVTPQDEVPSIDPDKKNIRIDPTQPY